MSQAPNVLYQHVPHPHTPRNPNQTHLAEQQAQGFNTRLAVWLTLHVGSMPCAYLFAAIGVGSLVGVLTGNALLAVLCGSLSSYFLQLVLLPILSVGQGVLGRKQELQADELTATASHTFHDLGQVGQHLDAQDTVVVATHAKTSALVDAVAALQESHAALHAKVDALATPPVAPASSPDATPPKRTRKALTPTPVPAESVTTPPAAELAPTEVVA
jgi:hypothetical protein